MHSFKIIKNSTDTKNSYIILTKIKYINKKLISFLIFINFVFTEISSLFLFNR